MSDPVEYSARKVHPEMLITAVKKRPAVWNSLCPEYKVKKSKERAWHDIASEVIDDWKEYDMTQKHITLRSLIKRWNNIRDYQVKSLKAQRRKKYAFADQLAFLQHEIQRKMDLELRMNQSYEFNIACKVEEVGNSLPEADTEEAEELIQEEYVTLVDTLDHDYDTTRTKAQEDKKYVEASSKEEDPDLMFLKSVLSDMKKLEEEEKFAFKYAIMQAYMDILRKRKS